MKKYGTILCGFAAAVFTAMCVFFGLALEWHEVHALAWVSLCGFVLMWIVTSFVMRRAPEQGIYSLGMFVLGGSVLLHILSGLSMIWLGLQMKMLVVISPMFCLMMLLGVVNVPVIFIFGLLPAALAVFLWKCYRQGLEKSA